MSKLRKTVAIAAIMTIGLVFLTPSPAPAQPCLSSGSLYGSVHAAAGVVARFSDGNAAYAYAKANCDRKVTGKTPSGTPFGPASLQPYECRWSVWTVAGGGVLANARWTGTKRIAAGDAAGCVFMCGGKTCRVRGSDGLPVELLQFGVE